MGEPVAELLLYGLMLGVVAGQSPFHTLLFWPGFVGPLENGDGGGRRGSSVLKSSSLSGENEMK